MTGTLINAGAIVLAGFCGLLLRRKIPENISNTMEKALGVLIIVLGIQYGIKAENFAVIGLSLAGGVIIGEWRNWDGRLTGLGKRLQSRFGNGESDFANGFVSASVLFCVGAMAVVGSLEEGLYGSYQILLVKSLLDAIFSIIFAASMGIGVIFSAIPVLIYQGSISLLAGLIEPILTEPVLNNMTSLGGILIAALGLNLASAASIRAANLLPGFLLLPVIMAVLSFF
ncbi:MAG: DUF554 domain-containing protein [Syntrophomonadaceae bacterium]|jgi:uncharacterized membrane protein YqgA involved in biofilm formation|nr:DUF554 domain-containing protein [Syntrophomonadaceae bacterium]